MAPHTSVTQIRLNNVIVYLTVAASALRELETAVGTPFLTTISNTTVSLLSGVQVSSTALHEVYNRTEYQQNAKSKRDECVQFLEHIHAILYGIIALHVNSDTGGVLAPATLDHIAKFTETLQKIRVFVESQQEGNRIKQFLRQSETSALLKDCNLGLQQALDVLKVWQYVCHMEISFSMIFQIQTGANILADLGDMQRNSEERHNKLLELIATLSDGSNSDRLSTINGSLIGSHNR
ncbi:hypothetical protein B0H10DRAFT_1970774 [Mycena sp. CBHHK59/15]|nr:hypothetical protein B0H10DRAFT_1970774 [Mycena sp. CBHHK59/15]